MTERLVTSPHLLDRTLTPEDRQAWTDHVAAVATTVKRGTTAAAIFRVGPEWLALPVAVLHSVAPPTAIHSLPHHGGGAILGITNVRGELLICVSLATILGTTSDAGEHTQRRMLVVSTPKGPLVFPVDEVFGVHRYLPEDVHDVPATLAQAEARYTTGLIPWRDRTVAQLDAAAIFTTIEHALAGTHTGTRP